MTTKLILGLGNPHVPEYEKTHHNLGKRIVVNAAEDLHSENWREDKKLMTMISEGKYEKVKIVFAQPLVYMNESGKTAALLQKFYKIKPADVLIIHDDSDIFFGKEKLSFGSRSAGHRGVESVIRALKTREFWRLRVGIRPPREKIRMKAEKLVLQKTTPAEEKILEKEIFPKTSEIIRAWITNKDK